MIPMNPIRVTGELRELRARLLALEKYVGAPTPGAKREAELKRRKEKREAALPPEPPSGPGVDGDLPTAAEGAVEAAEPALEPELGPPVADEADVESGAVPPP